MEDAEDEAFFTGGSRKLLTFGFTRMAGRIDGFVPARQRQIIDEMLPRARGAFVNLKGLFSLVSFFLNESSQSTQNDDHKA